MSRRFPRNYDKLPTIRVPDTDSTCVRGWWSVVEQLHRAVVEGNRPKTVVTVECYPGVDTTEIASAINSGLKPTVLIQSKEAFLPAESIDALVEPFLGGEDPVFGFLSGLRLPEFLDSHKTEHFRSQVESVESGIVVVLGCGASAIASGDLLVYADLPRWEWQLRSRKDAVDNLGVENRALAASQQYKRAFFVDWRVADRWKRSLISRWDFYLDTHVQDDPKLVTGEAIRRGLRHTVTRPFRVVPFFDPAPWGGQWMKQACDLDQASPNFGWCFDCVPEENSLLLQFGEIVVEMPSLNLLFGWPRDLLGEAVHARFGDEFPIRFDFLDTMGGGNLSFQVHPLTEYIQHHFGMHYTQDESYYLLDAEPDATVYLGLKEGVDRDQMRRDLQRAQQGELEFPADRYANRWPAKRHDHFLIPAGTVHCSGANSMVLEISATPYIFTFKMWDWGRLGLDGNPRPIHLDHGLANVQWDRTTDWVQQQLINLFEPLESGDGWREERTGLHAREFIETRRHWFTQPTPHHTQGGVNVLNLVQGNEAIVESPEGAFEPFTVHYAETFIVPACVGPYVVRPVMDSNTEEFATMKAFVRT